MSINMGQFDKDAKAAAERVVAEAKGVMTGAAQLLMSELTKPALQNGTGSPIASGRYVSSMRMALNEVDTSTEPPAKGYRYPPGRGPRALPPRAINLTQNPQKAAILLARFKLGDRIIISDSVPYVRKIEVGGHSWQAPGGVFTPTVRAVIARLRNVKVGVSVS